MAVTLSAALNALASTSAPDKVIVLEGSTAKQTDPANVGGAGYLKYVALLTQSGTSAPTATVLENTLGGTVVWSYLSVGQYVGTLTGAFVENKFFYRFNRSRFYAVGCRYIRFQKFNQFCPLRL